MVAPNKEEGLAAIAAANPKWSKRHVAYAWELMPTSTEIYYEKGTAQHAQAHAYWLYHWTLWAIEMNLMPDDTPLPEYTDAPGSPGRRRTPPVDPATSNTPKSPVAPKAPTAHQNEIAAPREGTVGKKIWDICDEVTAKHGRQATVEEVSAVARERGLNEGNTRTEFSRWRKFNSIVEP